ncbi:Ribonuclease D [Parasponia andersonii]|uniref:Ribonuclease D n=1 Tax=Parasponia andersonii TaxID=3476 RepID=A0A2P5BY22_PARAD|nr:Ribonuclease D [Parasponia andersonii]
MADDAMNVDQSPQPSKPQPLHALTKGPFASSVSKLSGSSRGIPSNQDFHFYYNFDEFRAPTQEIAMKSQSMLGSIGSSSWRIWGKEMAFPEDTDEAYDWLVDVNDEIFERFDMSVDEFQRIRKKDEETGLVTNAASAMDDGFQLVCGKKKKGASHLPSGNNAGRDLNSAVSGVKLATKDKKTTTAMAKVPFHIPTITRPQQEFNILVNNSNQPFEHVWLQRSEDGQRFVHPLEKLSFSDFVDKDKDVLHIEPVKPPPVECTSFKLVEEVKDLKELAAKLRGVNEFAVDLEHNQYRSFQGLTCLIQISTRTEDFVIDALKLRVDIGPYLREVFKDPTKRKVMHGADRDIFWLQRDFGIYICNLFDTGQASRILKLERNSLEYLLHHFCGVTANKEYQNADWRLRPLPEEMLRYAREDTHYLLHIYDLMRMKLFSLSKESDSADASLLEVYRRSYDICMQLYEKELLTENSYLYVYGLQGAGFNAQQLAIVAGLCEWRDVVARAEDESTGYILPNKTLLEIAKQMPVTTSQLRRLVKSKHPYIEHNLGSVLSIIRNSMQNATAFEAAAEQLKEGRIARALEGNLAADDEPEASKIAIATTESTSNGKATDNNLRALSSVPFELDKNGLGNSSEHPGESGSGKSAVLKEDLTVSGQREDRSTSTSLSDSAKATAVTVQVQKKPSGAFGALLGNTTTKKKFDSSKKEKEEVKLEKIRASVHFPFHSFSSIPDQSKPVVEAPVAALEVPISDGPADTLLVNSKLDDIIMLQDDNAVVESGSGESGTTKEDADDNSVAKTLEIDKEEPMSLSDLSSSFQQCFQSANQNKKTRQVDRSQESSGLQLKPFDYEAVRKEVIFGENSKEHRSSQCDSKGKKKSDKGRPWKDDESSEFSQGRRRKAFPATGNRSSTFR